MATNVSTFRNNIMADAPGCPIPRVDAAIVEAMRKFCEDTFRLEKTIEAFNVADVTFPFALPFNFAAAPSGDFYVVTIDLTDYTSLANLDPIMPIFCQIDGVDTTLRRFDLDNLVSSIDTLTPDSTKFYRFTDTETMEIFPFEEQDEVNFVVTLAMKPSSDVTSVDDKFLNEWREAVEARALFRLQKMPKRPWTDLEQAVINKAIYDAEIGRHKIYRQMGDTYGSAIMQGGYF